MVGPRQLVVCVFRRGPRILVGRGYDAVKDEHFYRPLGGGVELGETPAEALRREIREEIGLEIDALVELGVIENRFVYDGVPGHEIVVVFDAVLTDGRFYDLPKVDLREEGWGGEATWLDLREETGEPLYPEGLRALLADSPTIGGS